MRKNEKKELRKTLSQKDILREIISGQLKSKKR
jgi:hypothetical protein